jgi:hydroxyethylthiazole kinase-like uncharacterized protein yjeF
MRPLQDLLDTHPLHAPRGAKDDRGSVLLAGGPAGCPGGVLLAAEAALRSGAGRLQLAVHPDIAVHVAVAAPETFVVPWDPHAPLTEEVQTCVEATDVTVVGPGYSDDLADAAAALTEGSGDRAVVLDAGALGAAPALRGSRRLVLAPNTGEAIELAGEEASEIELALILAERLRHPLAVRGRTSVVTDGDGATWCYDGGGTGLGTPGSGDVLIGMLAALLARGVAPVGALGWAIALHGRAGEIIERTMPVGYLARDLVAHLPAAFVELGAL